MTQPQLRPSATEIDTLHRQWLEHPITRQLARLLDEHKDKIVDAISISSRDITEDGLRKLSQLSVQLATLKTIKKLIFDTETFSRNSQHENT